MGRPTPEIPLTLRNFRIPDDLYYKFEFLAKQHNRTVTAHIAAIMLEEVENEKAQHGYQNNDMLTKARKLKQINIKNKENAK